MYLPLVGVALGKTFPINVEFECKVEGYLVTPPPKPKMSAVWLMASMRVGVAMLF